MILAQMSFTIFLLHMIQCQIQLIVGHTPEYNFTMFSISIWPSTRTLLNYDDFFFSHPDNYNQGKLINSLLNINNQVTLIIYFVTSVSSQKNCRLITWQFKKISGFLKTKMLLFTNLGECYSSWVILSQSKHSTSDIRIQVGI